MIFKTKARLVRENAELEAQMVGMEAQLSVSQAQIEVMNLAVEREAVKMAEFIGRLVETMGVSPRHLAPENEAETLARIRQLRAWADQYMAIRDVLAGRFDADAALLKQLACALGCSDFSKDAVVARAGVLSGAHVRVAQMEVELREAKDGNLHYLDEDDRL